MTESIEVQCPHCFEWQELDLDPDTQGRFVQDCEVCCHPWQVHVEWHAGGPHVVVERAQ